MLENGAVSSITCSQQSGPLLFLSLISTALPRAFQVLLFAFNAMSTTRMFDQFRASRLSTRANSPCATARHIKCHQNITRITTICVCFVLFCDITVLILGFQGGPTMTTAPSFSLAFCHAPCTFACSCSIAMVSLFPKEARSFRRRTELPCGR